MWLFELARVLVRLDHVANVIIHANHGMMRSAVMLRVSDCITDSVWSAIQEATEWQRIANQIDAAMIFAKTHFVNVRWLHRG